MCATPCVACHGYRLKPEALAVKIDGRHIGAGHASCRSGPRSTGSTALPAKLDAKRNEIAERILKEIRDRLTFLLDVGPRLPDAGARLRHAVGRREPAHPARLADRLRPDRRALCARRALDRPAPARQRAPARHAAAAARPRQHRDRRRARRGRDPHRRLRGRCRPGRRHPRRRDRRRRHAGRDHAPTRTR